MKNANKGGAADLDGRGLRIGIVQARFNEDITDALAKACLGELEQLGVAADDIDHLSVPGALTGMARNPDTYGNLLTNMILGIAFSEAIAIYCLAIAFLILLKIF